MLVLELGQIRTSEDLVMLAQITSTVLWVQLRPQIFLQTPCKSHMEEAKAVKLSLFLQDITDLKLQLALILTKLLIARLETTALRVVRLQFHVQKELTGLQSRVRVFLSADFVHQELIAPVLEQRLQPFVTLAPSAQRVPFSHNCVQLEPTTTHKD